MSSWRRDLDFDQGPVVDGNSKAPIGTAGSTVINAYARHVPECIAAIGSPA